MADIIIGILIFGYTGFLIGKKVWNTIESKHCLSGCASCPGKISCKSNNFKIKKGNRQSL
jgi:hypothetical protein